LPTPKPSTVSCEPSRRSDGMSMPSPRSPKALTSSTTSVATRTESVSPTHKIRHLGLYATPALLSKARARVGRMAPRGPSSSWRERLRHLTGRDVGQCPRCGNALLMQPLPIARAPPATPSSDRTGLNGVVCPSTERVGHASDTNTAAKTRRRALAQRRESAIVPCASRAAAVSPLRASFRRISSVASARPLRESHRRNAHNIRSR
jgi:hypothetical protein